MYEAMYEHDIIYLPNCEVHITKLSSSCCHIFMALFTHCQLYIKCYLALKHVDYLNAFQVAHQINNYMMLLSQQLCWMCNIPKIDCGCDWRLILSRNGYVQQGQTWCQGAKVSSLSFNSLQWYFQNLIMELQKFLKKNVNIELKSKEPFYGLLANITILIRNLIF